MALAIGILSSPAARADGCRGEDALLNVLDRPTVADSPCAAPTGHGIAEFGLSVGPLPQVNGHATTAPEGEMRFGLGHDRELAWVMPSLVWEGFAGQPSLRGTTAGTWVLKQGFGSLGASPRAIEIAVTPKGASAAFGSAGTGYAGTAIASTSRGAIGVSASVTAGVAYGPVASGGARTDFQSLSLVGTMALGPRSQAYAEAYGTWAPGATWLVDAGWQFLMHQTVEIDLEEGVLVRGSGALFAHYTGIGGGFLF